MTAQADFRSRFPICESKAYLNACSYGALCLEAEAAMLDYLSLRHRQGADWGGWIGKLEAVRGLIARQIGAKACDISVSSSLSESVNALASSLDFDGVRRTVVLTEFDFPTTAQIWRAQERRGARIVEVASRDELRLRLEDVAAAIDEQTLIVSIPYVCYWNGARIDVEPIIRRAHAAGALVLVDAFQAVGAFPFSVQDMAPDFLAGGCTKYLLGSAGCGFLYVRNSQGSRLQPAVSGWFAQADPHAMELRHIPAADARRFEAGTPPVPSLYTSEAGLRLLEEVGADWVWSRIVELTDQIKREARAGGYQLATPQGPDEHGAMIAIRVADAPAMVDRLAQSDVLVTSRAGNVRVSPHAYNDAADIDALFRAMHEGRATLRAS